LVRLSNSRTSHCKSGDLRKSPRVKLANRSAKHDLVKWPTQVAIRDPRRTHEPRTLAATNDAFLACTPRSWPLHGKASLNAEWNARHPPAASRAGPVRLPFTPALLAKAHLFGKVRTGLGIIRSDHRIIGCKPPFLAVLVRRQIVLSPQMPLQRLEFSPIFKAHEKLSRD
jgi:hypothetical protein